jgi:hypothetical protein
MVLLNYPSAVLPVVRAKAYQLQDITVKGKIVRGAELSTTL